MSPNIQYIFHLAYITGHPPYPMGKAQLMRNSGTSIARGSYLRTYKSAKCYTHPSQGILLHFPPSLTAEVSVPELLNSINIVEYQFKRFHRQVYLFTREGVGFRTYGKK
jgi:hypothetical protein